MATASGNRQSLESATRNGINALEQAYMGVDRCKNDVETTKLSLTTGYQGSDGGRFQSLVTAWEAKATTILKSLEEMIETLNETLREQGLQQGSANTKVEQAYQEAQGVYDQLTG
ncbi:hypothetical protein [Streptomyces sp. NPDC020681]|uniref:hypothetical protein n=1 Tax=Streptomyces sp. NPDC020681 TaxID=3365083 RepID=UPI0037AD193B